MINIFYSMQSFRIFPGKGSAFVSSSDRRLRIILTGANGINSRYIDPHRKYPLRGYNIYSSRCIRSAEEIRYNAVSCEAAFTCCFKTRYRKRKRENGYRRTESSPYYITHIQICVCIMNSVTNVRND